MTFAMKPVTSIKLKGHRKRQLADTLLKMHARKPKVLPPPDPIRVVCVSDTHNTRPVLPFGDVLIHAGDLTENGSFDEVQAELKWLSNQPHKYKVLIAGNHDVLFDETFLAKHPERRYGQTKTKEDLDWGTITYLQDTWVTFKFPSHHPVLARQNATTKFPSPEPRRRKLTIFGSPWTPQYGVSAFQYRPDDESHWAVRFASLGPKPDIFVTHCPPKHHLDARDFHRAGCPYLAEELARFQPRLVVFGHIHASYGREDVVLDSVQRAFEEVMTGWAGWEKVGWMVALVLWARLKWLFGILGEEEGKTTTFVNAAVVGGPKNELRNESVVVEL